MRAMLRARNEEERKRQEEKARNEKLLAEQKKEKEERERQEKDAAQMTEIHKLVKHALEDSKTGGRQMIVIDSKWSSTALAPFFEDESIFVYVKFSSKCRKCSYPHTDIRSVSARDCSICLRCRKCDPFFDCCEHPQHV